MITYASQQGTPWSGFNGLGTLGVALADWSLNPATGVWTAPDGSPGWNRNADGTFTGSVVDGLGNVIVYTVDEDMNPVGSSTVTPETTDGVASFFETLSQMAGNLLHTLGLGSSGSVTPIPTGSGSFLNPGTWSLPMILLIGGGVYWLASSRKRTRSRARRNPRRRRRFTSTAAQRDSERRGFLRCSAPGHKHKAWNEARACERASA